MQIGLARKILILLLPITLSLAQRIGFKVPPGLFNRRFSLSTRAPLSKAINDLAPDTIPHVELILNHALRVENAVRESLTRLRFNASEPIQPCNQAIHLKYRKSIWRSFSMRGFAEPAFDCGADVHGVILSRNDEPGYTLDDLYEAIVNRGAAIKRRVKDIALRVIDNFTSPGVPFNYSYKTATAHCSMSAVCLAREGDHWRNAVTISSTPNDHFVADGQQQNIGEYVRVVDGKLGGHMLLRLPVYDDGTIERVMLDNTTTLIQSFRRNPNPSCFRKICVYENPAMLEALDLAEHSSEIVEGALTSSNLAILLLPLGLNLIPLSLIAEVGTKTMLLYTIFSDVLTVVPLGIKGVELVIIQKQKYRSVVTRMMSPGLRNATKPFAAGGEMWGAECQIKNEARKVGYALIITAIVFLIFGVGSEIVASKYADWRRRKRRLAEKLEDDEDDDANDDARLFFDIACLEESVLSSSNGNGIARDYAVETGAVTERCSADLERDDMKKKRFWSFR